MARIVLNMPRNETDDHRPMIQKALDDVNAAGGGEVFIPDGTHYLGPPEGGEPPSPGAWSLKIGSHTHLRMGTDAVLIRRFDSTRFEGQPGSLDPTIQNRDLFVNTNKNIRISGGTIELPTTGGPYNGKHIEMNTVKGVTIDGVRFMGVDTNWNVAVGLCQDVQVRGVFMDSGDTFFED